MAITFQRGGLRTIQILLQPLHFRVAAFPWRCLLDSKNRLENSVSFESPGKSGFSKHAFHEVPFGFRRGTVPGATDPQVPKNKSKEAYMAPAPKARWYCRVFAVKCFAGCMHRGTVSGTAPLHSKSVLKTYLYQVGRHVGA